MELINHSLFSDANLKAYYRFNSGALITDSSSNGVTLTNNNTVGEASGKFGIGADFGSSNTNKYLSSTNALGISGGAITMSFWIKLNTEISTSIQVIISQSSNTSNVVFQLVYDYNGGNRRLVFYRTRLGQYNDQVYYPVTLGTSDWHHIVFTYNGTNIIGYVDATASSPVSASGTGTSQPIPGITIGSGQSGNFPISAIIDDVAFFNRALTGTEITNLYTSTFHSSTFTEIATLSEIFSKIRNKFKTYLETSTLSEIFRRYRTTIKSEISTLSDVFSNKKGFKQSLTDTSTLSDPDIDATKSRGLEYIENLILSDIFRKTWNTIRSFIDNITGSDSLTKQQSRTRTLTDTQTPSDTITRSQVMNRAFSDFSTITDKIKKYLNGNPIIIYLYTLKNTLFTNKYSSKNTTYTNKYNKKETDY